MHIFSTYFNENFWIKEVKNEINYRTWKSWQTVCTDQT